MRNKLDLIKGLATIGVILVHTMPQSMIVDLQLIFTFNQQVPIFIMISVITFTASFKRKEIFENFKLKQYISYLKDKVTNIILPIMFIFIISALIFEKFNLNGYGFGKKNLVFLLPIEGPGNYYIFLLIQFIILIPIIYHFKEKNLKLTILILVIMNVFMETFLWKLSIFSDYYIYKSCILRYFSVIAIGLIVVEILNGRKKFERIIYMLAPLSYIYMLAVNNNNFKFSWIYEKSWHQQNLFTSFYVGALMILLIKYIPEESNNYIYLKLKKIGQYSFYIFLSQIIYFSLEMSVYDEILRGKFINLNSIYIYILTVTVDIILCYILAKILKYICYLTVKFYKKVTFD